MAWIRKHRGERPTEPLHLPRPRFGHLVHETFGVGRAELESGLEEQQTAPARIGAILRRRGVLDRQQVKQVLQTQARWTVAVAESLFPGHSFPLKSSLSLCLPAYNEAANIEDTLDGACAVLGEVVEDSRIIVANDGSRDGTGAVLARYAENEPRLQVVTHPQNRGYGAALTSALRAARTDLAWILDSDGQFSPLDLVRLLCRREDRAVVIGYRRQRADNWLRRFDAWAWNRLIRFVLGVPVRDLDCAFKLIPREVLEDVDLSSRGACISAEILVQCVRKGLKIVEVPVEHYPRAHGAPTGGAAAVIARAFRELPRLVKHRWRPRTAGNRDRHLLPERPSGCCAEKAPVPFSETSSASLRRKAELPDVPLTVCLLAACPFPANHGTPGSIREMAEAVAEKGHEVHVVTYHFGDDDIRVRGVHLHRITPWTKETLIVVGPTVRRPMYDLQMIFKTLEVIRRYRPAVLQAHGYEAALAAWACKLVTGVPVIYSGHNTMADELPSYNFFRPRWIAAGLGRLLDAIVPRLADRRIPHSENMREFFRRQKLLSRTEPVINFGINLEEVGHGDRDAVRERYGLGQAPVVAYAGVLNAFQRLDLLLEAMAVVVRQLPTAKLLMVSTVPAPRFLADFQGQAARLGLTDHLVITEPQPLQSVQETLAACDVAVASRIREPGFPIKLLNYMAVGKACVLYASSAPGLQHRQDAFLASPDTGEALGEAIVEVLGDDELRRRLASRGHEYVRSRHDRRLVAEQLVQVYMRTLLGIEPPDDSRRAASHRDRISPPVYAEIRAVGRRRLHEGARPAAEPGPRAMRDYQEPIET